jgi:hypothetical protein
MRFQKAIMRRCPCSCAFNSSSPTSVTPPVQHRERACVKPMLSIEQHVCVLGGHASCASAPLWDHAHTSATTSNVAVVEERKAAGGKFIDDDAILAVTGGGGRGKGGGGGGGGGGEE